MNCRSARNCAPCGDCPPPPAPVLPRCDNVLSNGVFPNATVTVEAGCITAVAAGEAPLYTPDPCCAPVGGGGPSGDGLPGGPGPPGAAATIAPGTVTTVAFGQPATVTNSGTASAAILNFQIPRGPAGADAPPASGLSYNSTGIVIANGLVQQLPLSWPPIHVINFTPRAATPDKITLNFTKAADGTADVTVDTTVLEADLAGQISTAIGGFQAQIDAQIVTIAAQNTTILGLQAQIDAVNTILTPINVSYAALQAQVAALQTRVNICCP